MTQEQDASVGHPQGIALTERPRSVLCQLSQQSDAPAKTISRDLRNEIGEDCHPQDVCNVDVWVSRQICTIKALCSGSC